MENVMSKMTARYKVLIGNVLKQWKENGGTPEELGELLYACVMIIPNITTEQYVRDNETRTNARKTVLKLEYGKELLEFEGKIMNRKPDNKRRTK